MRGLLPETMPDPRNPEGSPLINAPAMVELARRTDTPAAKAFLVAYHEAEADVARRKPFLSEGMIRAEAVVIAAKALGATVTVDGKPA